VEGYNHRMQREFEVRTSLDRLLHYWWIILLCMVAGAGIGYLIHLNQVPLYEARSSISTSINYAETGLMTDLEEDDALSNIGEIVLSDQVVSRVQSSIDRVTSAFLDGNLRSHLFAEREGYRWVLRVQAKNSASAQKVSEVWAAAAIQVLQDGLAHSRQALAIQRQMADLENCFSQSVAALPSYPTCDAPSRSTIQQNLKDLGTQYADESGQSLGILPALSFTVTENGNSDGSPVTYGKAGMIFSGAMLGFLGGVILVLAGLPKRSTRADESAK
jgi:hypothetical protein